MWGSGLENFCCELALGIVGTPVKRTIFPVAFNDWGTANWAFIISQQMVVVIALLFYILYMDLFT